MFTRALFDIEKVLYLYTKMYILTKNVSNFKEHAILCWNILILNIINNFFFKLAFNI